MAMSRWGEKRAVAVALAALFVGVGCATNKDVSGARSDAEQARRIAEDANAKASAAAADAAAARAAAERAAQDAREANEKADRIFQRSLHK
jgi:hypothetical protein